MLPITDANAYICFVKTYGVLSTKISRIMPPPNPVSNPIDIENNAIPKKPDSHAISTPIAEKVARPTASKKLFMLSMRFSKDSNLLVFEIRYNKNNDRGYCRNY